MEAKHGGIRRWVRQLVRPERLRVVVAAGGIVVLSAIASAVVVAEGSTGDTVGVPISDAGRDALTEAAASCPALTPARLAGLIMTTTGFEPTAEGGIGGLTAAEWEVWKPWDGAVPDDDRASALALAHLTCDLVGHLRHAGLSGDRWRLAVAAFASSLARVRAVAGVPAEAAAFVEQVELYTAWYAPQLGEPPVSTSSRATVASTSDASPSVEPTGTTTTTSASPTPEAPNSTAPPPTTAPTFSLNYPRFADASGLHLNGSARIADGRLDLTTGLHQAGSAWARSTIDISRSFTTTFSAVVKGGADGLALVIQNEGPAALGDTGAGLGYGSRPNGQPDEGIRPSVAVEIDAWDNSLDGFDPGHHHLAVTTNGEVTRHLISADPGFSLSNSQPFHVWVSYDAAARTLAVYASRSSARPANPLFVHSIDLRSHLGTDRAYLGITGGTGNTNVADAYESVLSWSASSS